MAARLLLDTHTLLWWATGSDRLPMATREVVGNSDTVFISLVSLWEIVIKESTRRPMVGTADAHRWFAEAIAPTGFQSLPIEARHIGAVQHLPAHHRDPFDRLLVAQAREHELAIVTRDAQIPLYDVDVVWLA